MHSWPPRQARCRRALLLLRAGEHRSLAAPLEASAGADPCCRLPGTLPAPRGHWQQVSPHEAVEGMPTLQKRPKKAQPALPLPGVPAAQVSGFPPPAGRRGLVCGGAEPESPAPCLRPTRGQSPHPAALSLRMNSETPFPGLLHNGAGHLDNVHRERGLYLLIDQGTRIQGTPTWPNPQACVFCFLSVDSICDVERADNTSVIINKVSVGKGFGLGRSGGVLFESVRYL